MNLSTFDVNSSIEKRKSICYNSDKSPISGTSEKEKWYVIFNNGSKVHKIEFFNE
jgi:hypothetical protein